MAAARRSPVLIDDLIIDILLHLPPDDIACLTRASLVCKAWHRIVSDRAFLRRYREIHGAPPFLGFLYNNYSMFGSSPFFIPTTPASPFSPRASAGSPTQCQTLDCRHGRVLLVHRPGYTSYLTVWDPVTGLQRCISTLSYVPPIPIMAAVLCASNGCDHLDCSNGPYLVVLLATHSRHPGVDVKTTPAWVYCYSSETRKWSASRWSTSFDLVYLGRAMPSLLVGDAVYFVVGSARVVKFDVTNGLLSVIWVTLCRGQNMILCMVMDGRLGVATMEGGSLHLVYYTTDPDGVLRWTPARVIELDSMIPNSVGGALTKFGVVGFAEGTGYIFVRANDGIFSVELKSGRISKIGSGNFGPIIFPFMRFYIPGTSPHAQLYHSSFISCDFVNI